MLNKEITALESRESRKSTPTITSKSAIIKKLSSIATGISLAITLNIGPLGCTTPKQESPTTQESYEPKITYRDVPALPPQPPREDNFGIKKHREDFERINNYYRAQINLLLSMPSIRFGTEEDWKKWDFNNKKFDAVINLNNSQDDAQGIIDAIQDNHTENVYIYEEKILQTLTNIEELLQSLPEDDVLKIDPDVTRLIRNCERILSKSLIAHDVGDGDHPYKSIQLFSELDQLKKNLQEMAKIISEEIY